MENKRRKIHEELEVVALTEWGEQYSIQTQNYKGLSFNNGELIQKTCIHLNVFNKLLIYSCTSTKLKYTFNPSLNKKK